MLKVKWWGDEVSKLRENAKEQILTKTTDQFKEVKNDFDFLVSYDGENYYKAKIEGEGYSITFQSDQHRMFNGSADYSLPFYGMEIYAKYKNKDLYRDGYVFYENNLKLSIPYSMDYCKVLNDIDRIVENIGNI